MYRLVNERTKRLITIIHLLVEHEKEIHIAEISKINNCSERTVYYDLEKLTEEWNHLLKLDISQAILLSKYEGSGDLKQVVTSLLLEDHSIKALFLLFECPNKNIRYYAEKLKRSPSNIQSIFRNIDSFLQNYNAGVKVIKNKYFIFAEDELRIRSVIAEIYWYLRKAPKNKTLTESTQIRINEIIQNSDLRGHEFVFQFFFSFYLVSELREAQGFSVDTLKSTFELLEDYLIFDDSLKQKMDIIFEHYIRKLFVIEEKKLKSVNDICLFFLKRNILYSNKVLPPVDRATIYSEMYAISNNKAHFSTQEMNQHLRLDIDVQRLLEECLFHIDMIYRTFENYHSAKILIISDISIKHAEVIRNFISVHFPAHETDMHCFDFYHQKDEINYINKMIEQNHYSVIVSTKLIPGIKKIPIAIVDDFPNDTSILKLFRSIYYRTKRYK